MHRELIYRGAAKDVYRVGRDCLEIVFVDDLAVFGRRLDVQLPGKGALLCDAATATLILAGRAGVATHLVERASDTSMVVIVGHPSAGAAALGGPIGAITTECVSRHRVAGSLLARLNGGRAFEEVDRPVCGAVLRRPMVEFCARNAATTSYFALPTIENSPPTVPLKRMAEASLAIDRSLADALAPSGLVHADGKKEFAYNRAGDLMLVDCFGTVEEDRIWRVSDEEILSDVSLDPVRRHYSAGGLRDFNARIPPPALIDQIFGSYQQLAECLSGATVDGHAAR